MSVELKIPAVGESITEVQIGEWLKAEGDTVQKDENLVEIETDKATVELPAPVAGIVVKVLKRAGETANVGEVIGYMEEGSGDGASRSAVASAPKPATAPPAAAQPAPAPLAAEKPAPAQAAPVQPGAEKPAGVERSPSPAVSPEIPPKVMPAARRELSERGLKADEVKASGPGGRLLKEDVQRHTPAPPAAAASAPAPTPTVPAKPARPEISGKTLTRGGREEEAVPMTPLRRRIAERLVEAQASAALLTTFNEIDMSGVMALRQEHRDGFQQTYGVKLGFMSFFVKATIEALKAIPQINAEIRGTHIVYHNYYDIGIAVSSAKGLVVPVLRNAERMSFAEVELAIEDFGRRARDNKIKLEELEGGTFTISNGGVFGSLLSTPIVNPPQSGIL
ncbi:MAG TPA: dihydrolipoyllysine-residue succinyltransferase, partial [Pirellulales bacterium]|nr:dihydrolipoyllysine-residue succinyltransferase [Pirellulales bacterium]